MAFSLPSLPVKHNDFLAYVKSKPERPMRDLIEPFAKYDAVLRQTFAQAPSHASIQDNYVNIVPLYDQSRSTDVRIRARNLASETPEEKEKYILPLSDELRKPHDSPAVVPTMDEFQHNFALFTEGSLSEIDWSNVVAAGSAVVTSLLPVPEKYRHSKRGLRQYYHEEFAPASDVDLFLYGLTEEQALEKIKHIEDKIRNTILYETTTIRTKNTITIASQYPNRHVQIVLRIYRSIAEILTGFDVDVSCVAYDGRQVFASPRAIAAYMTQVNQIDLTRRSPSYENRLSKYSHRGFEVFWPQLDRSKIDPTIFERSFTRTEGLARLLVLEKLPLSQDRDNYLQKRREERGRPALNIYMRRRQGKELRGNIKDAWEDEVPEWQEQDQVSDYHTFTIPYGRNFNARKIEKLLYTKDLLLNAQWNQPKDREVYLHRHPAFFGEAEHVIHDCCGFCPQPANEEEKKVAEEESKIYISGDVSFIKDDPGRQEIGSFNPITETDWTEMAYVGRTERLCQAIVSNDLEAVKAFLAEDGTNPDRRDYTGRTPLQLACMSSTAEIVQCLVDCGARMIPRMADGKTALHLAAARGDVEIIRILLTKSNQNEEEEENKKDDEKKNDKKEDNDDAMSIDGDETKDDMSLTSESYVKIENEDKDTEMTTYDTLEDNELEPDVYDINVVAWDSRTSPLHLAILHGHIEVVKELVTSFGADVLMPIKILNDYSKKPEAAILTLVLALSLPSVKAREMSKTLLELGASPAQADLAQKTPLYYIAHSTESELLDVYLHHDEPAVRRAINHLATRGSRWSPEFSSPLMVSLAAKSSSVAMKLLDTGAKPEIKITEFVKALKAQRETNHLYGDVEEEFKSSVDQPILQAVESDLPLVAIDLLKRGANVNTERKQRYQATGQTVLDLTREILKTLRGYMADPSYRPPTSDPNAMVFDKDDESYLAEFVPGSYKMFLASVQLRSARKRAHDAEERFQKAQIVPADPPGTAEKRQAIAELIRQYDDLEAELLTKGGKTFKELHPVDQPQQTVVAQVQPEKREPKKNVFRVRFNFRMVGITDDCRRGYLTLFEAAWNGDIATIRKLTLGMWGATQDQLPLEIAVSDSRGLSCLSIAIIRGHLDVAKSILQILRAQLKVKEPRGSKQTRFEIAINDDECSEEDEDDDDHLNIVGDEVDDTFTHDNVGEDISQVESDVTPFQAFSKDFDAFLFLDVLPPKHLCRIVPDNGNYWVSQDNVKINSLVKYAVYKNDLPLLEFLLETGKDLAQSNPHGKLKYSVSSEEFQLAIGLGRIDCLSKLIQSTGAGLPLAKLSQDCGVEARKEPQYYPGLSIRGTKRADWADAGRGGEIGHPDQRPPLLIAALQGNLASTEFFLGTGPGRYYLEYLNSIPDDEDVKRLAESQLGVEGTLLSWLQTRNNLVIHCAVMCRPSDETERLLQYLVDHHPECIEVRSSGGLTPLALAMSLHRVRFARILIAAGANQATRDSEANNILHLILHSAEGRNCRNSERCGRLINLLDQQLIPIMLIERAGDSSQTPFARWLRHCPSSDHRIDQKEGKAMVLSMTNLILNLANSSNQRHLELFDGAGNTVAHDAVKGGQHDVLEQILDRRPDLLYRENATGTTALEMAVDSWVNQQTSAPPESPHKNRNLPPQRMNMVSRSPVYFVEGISVPDHDVNIMLRVCQGRAQQTPSKRRLVSLFEANEVAKRLAVKSEEHGYGYGRRRGRYQRSSVREEDEVTMSNHLAAH
ncbi:hypothetical protein N7508_003851 [Penicillium antarcticum]|uniref:uncharacterized protein n=1 Tax=Penicillium antarcticum TaxID=416450 RepID=UPI00238505F2|nr:uncharacterized protein N7508_003851 [Penicillium antarcticum]KAJ5313021.1 hypothetical protein N7508_003851 [Penicillium antarcticum]